MCGTKGVLHLASSKSGKRNHVEEQVSIDDRRLASFGAALTKMLQPGDRVLRYSVKLLRKRLRILLQELNLQDLYILPYSFRRGGATVHFRGGGNMAAIVARGRWGSSQTARIYVNEALQDAEELRTSKEDRLLLKAAAELETFFA